MDAMEIANILATELWCHQLASLDGLNSGVPTRTTATLTPTHLRNIEQTFIELQCRNEQSTHVGFVPPSVATTHASNHYGILNTTAYHDVGPGTLHVSPGPMSTMSSEDSSSSPGLPVPKRRNMGGRRPNKVDENLTPEEEERRRVRRERNKQAAARCRKRRLDQTNELQEETDKLEKAKQNLQDELRQLNQSREQLEYILNNHLLGCRLPKRAPSPPDVKPFQTLQGDYPLPMPPSDDVRVKIEIVDPDPVIGLDNDIFDSPVTEKRIMLSSANPQVLTSCHQTSSSGSLDTPPIMPKRPNSLQVPFTLSPAQVHNIKNGAELAGIDITTPSTGISFNFDSLMDGGTGLTPVALQPCATQQQKSHIEIVSPESANPRLVNL